MTDTQTAPVSTPSTPVSPPPSEPPAKKTETQSYSKTIRTIEER